MATYVLSPIYNANTYFDNSGNILSGGMLYAYQAGSTSILQNTYATSTGTPNSNPIVLNSSGRSGAVWLDTSLVYKFVLTDLNGNIIQSTDNVVGITANVPTTPLELSHKDK